MSIPRRVSTGSICSADRSVSPQPAMAVSGVRSSWETEETNSDCICPFWLILLDISLIVIRQLADLVVIFLLNLDTVAPGGDALGRRRDIQHRVQDRADEEFVAQQNQRDKHRPDEDSQHHHPEDLPVRHPQARHITQHADDLAVNIPHRRGDGHNALPRPGFRPEK